MTPHTQLFVHDPENGVNGDCFRSAVASLLDLPLLDVPHFFQEEEGGVERIREFFATRGEVLGAIGYQECTLPEALAMSAEFFPNTHILMSGAAPNGVKHVVIVKDGAMVHDTNPGQGFIVGPVNGQYTFSFVMRKL